MKSTAVGQRTIISAQKGDCLFAPVQAVTMPPLKMHGRRTGLLGIRNVGALLLLWCLAGCSWFGGAQGSLGAERLVGAWQLTHSYEGAGILVDGIYYLQADGKLNFVGTAQFTAANPFGPATAHVDAKGRWQLGDDNTLEFSWSQRGMQQPTGGRASLNGIPVTIDVNNLVWLPQPPEQRFELAQGLGNGSNGKLGERWLWRAITGDVAEVRQPLAAEAAQ